MPVEKGLNIDALMSIPQIYGPIISPDRSHVAMAVNRLHENYDVFVVPTKSRAPEMSLTNTPEATELTDWAPDSKAVLVSEDTAGDERSTLYQVFLDEPEQLIPLTEKAPEHFMRGGYFWPSGDMIVYGVNYDYDTKRETETFRVVVQDIDSMKRTIVARPDRPAYLLLSADPKGRYILYSRSDEDPSGMQWWIASPDGTEDREILNFGPTAKVLADWTHDGRVLFTTDTLDGARADSVGVGLFDLAGDDTEWLVRPSAEEPFDYAYAFRYSRHALLIRERDAKTKPFIYDFNSLRLTECAPARGTLLPIAELSLGEWVGTYESSTSAQEIVKFNPFDPNPERFVPLTGMLKHSGVTSQQLVQAEDYRWVSVDGVPIHGWLYRPPRPNEKTIVYVHGGPSSHSKDRLSVGIQYLCSKGFTVLDPNYRGSTGYGVEFRELIKADGWGGKDKDDVRTGIESLLTDGIAKTYSVGIFGTSYGGYMSWNAIVHFPSKVLAAAAPICGMTDLVVDYETTRPDLRPYSEEMMGGSPSDIPEKYHERSPINFVQNIKGQVLIVQGARDPNVTPTNVREVEKSLEKHGIRYEKLVFEDEGHGIIREANLRVLLERLADFFETSL
jgi:dipeptidyl aminopeptidase/acylaminoacyl peptidase